VPAQEKAIICVGLDDKDQAFRLLDEACQEHFAPLPSLLNNPIMSSLRSDPRFAELARCGKLRP
jgi:hypothetical protein